jgi:hypothetical protein
MPVIIVPPSFPPESQLDYHKRLQTKLDKVMKKKDYTLLLELTKAKMVTKFSLPKLLPLSLKRNTSQVNIKEEDGSSSA